MGVLPSPVVLSSPYSPGEGLRRLAMVTRRRGTSIRGPSGARSPVPERHRLVADSGPASVTWRRAEQFRAVAER